ncbi:MAG: SDR family oxidoreductase [Anaerolineales bacterium]|nr:SDR family oxidoreductase [Anaerolineales bacterium]
MSARFSERVAIVTGGGSGIGEAIAVRLAAEGARVIVFDREPAALERVSAQHRLDGLSVDIADEELVEARIAQVVGRYGRLDILVNSAGIVGPTSTNIVAYRSADFLNVLNVNLTGSFYVTKYAIQAMLPGNYGRILLLASMAGKEGNPGMVGYATAKAGVIGLVKAIGKEYAETGITVNGLAPAVIRTPMNEKTAPEQLRYLTERIPMKRLGTVDEAAALACWIVSDEASFTTGFVFDLSGGRATY